MALRATAPTAGSIWPSSTATQHGSRSRHVQVQVRCSSVPAAKPQRRSANYQPSSWDYDALLLSLDSGRHGHKVCPSRYYNLKGAVRDMLLKKAEPSSKLRIIDVMERLGISYHFEEEISSILGSISMQSDSDRSLVDIGSMALKFRLLRENGFPTTPEPLSFYNYGKCNIRRTLQPNVDKLISLYEASHLAFRDEEMLDVGRAFSANALKELMPSMLPHLRKGVAHAIELPLHRRAPRLETRWFMDHYTRDIDMCPLLLQFAKLDFNRVQEEHQQDLSMVIRWWRHIALDEKLPFARDRLMECFHYANGIVWEPELGPCRQLLAKVSTLIVHLDDVYDVYGTLDELVLFTDEIGRWDANPCETLPEYMKALYSVIYHTTNEVAYRSSKEHGCKLHYLLQKSWHNICMAFLVEAKWHHRNYRPSLQEYLENGSVSSSAPLLLLHAFPMLNSVVNLNALDQLQSNPRLIQSASLILLLCNDSATHSAEIQRGDAPSSIAIHMFEKGVDETNSRKAMKELILQA